MCACVCVCVCVHKRRRKRNEKESARHVSLFLFYFLLSFSSLAPLLDRPPACSPARKALDRLPKAHVRRAATSPEPDFQGASSPPVLSLPLSSAIGLEPSDDELKNMITEVDGSGALRWKRRRGRCGHKQSASCLVWFFFDDRPVLLRSFLFLCLVLPLRSRLRRTSFLSAAALRSFCRPRFSHRLPPPRPTLPLTLRPHTLQARTPWTLPSL